jgi:hypothetical protein
MLVFSDFTGPTVTPAIAAYVEHYKHVGVHSALSRYDALWPGRRIRLC